MMDKIGQGSSGFSNVQPLTVAGKQLFTVSGSDGDHFFYLVYSKIVWLQVMATDSLPIVKQAVDTF